MITTDAYKFYELIGFKVVAKKVVGVDNPAWGGAPVTIHIVSIAVCIVHVAVSRSQY